MNKIPNHAAIIKVPEVQGLELPELAPVNLDYSEALVDHLLLKGLVHLDHIMTNADDPKNTISATKTIVEIGKYISNRKLIDSQKSINIVDDLDFLNSEPIREAAESLYGF